jgi:DUF971 family protein
VGDAEPKEVQPFPVSVDLIRAENLLLIEWDDGNHSRLGGDRLRWACPCAECKGEGGSPGRLDSVSELSDTELRLSDVVLVGQYALQIAFQSGHATGIYTFRHLRSLGITD